MLQNLREKFTGWIALAILGLIAVTFVFVGGASFTFIGGNYAAKVDGVEIGIGQFEQAYQETIQQTPQFAALPEVAMKLTGRGYDPDCEVALRRVGDGAEIPTTVAGRERGAARRTPRSPSFRPPKRVGPALSRDLAVAQSSLRRNL